MTKSKDDSKIEIEREYVVPLRKGWLKVPEYKRANKAVKTLKEFIARHMKVYDRDLKKIKVDIDLNNQIRFRGMKKPPVKIKVKAIKFSDGKVKVELVDIPDKIRFKRLREERKTKIKKAKSVEKSNTGKENKENISEEVKEKEEASKEETLKIAKQKAKEQKHLVKEKKVQVQRKTLSR